MKKFLSAFVLITVTGMLFFSFDDTSCDEVVCPYQHSICIGGECTCAAGYEGSNCEIEIRQKYIGQYQVSESCTTSFGSYQPQQFFSSISPTGRIEVVSISNFSNRGIPIEATLADETYIGIPSQQVSAMNFTGGEGLYEAFANRIRFEYQYSVSGTAYNCNATFVKY